MKHMDVIIHDYMNLSIPKPGKTNTSFFPNINIHIIILLDSYRKKITNKWIGKIGKQS